MLACDLGHAEAVKLLIEAGAALDSADASGDTALHMAVMCEHEEVVCALLRAGADHGVHNHEGESAWDVAEAYLDEGCETREMLSKHVAATLAR